MAMSASPAASVTVEYGPSGNQGDRFGVPSLDDDESMAQGQIVFYVNEKATPDGGTIGLPLDLNGDGDSVDEDVSATYGILPVRVSIEWMGALGRQRMEHRYRFWIWRRVQLPCPRCFGVPGHQLPRWTQR